MTFMNIHKENGPLSCHTFAGVYMLHATTVHIFIHFFHLDFYISLQQQQQKKNEEEIFYNI